MPVSESSAVFLAHRYLLLTQNLIASIQSESFHELADLFDERDNVLEAMSTLTIDSATKQVIEEAAGLDRELLQGIATQADEVKDLLLGQFRERKGLGGYRHPEPSSGGVQDAIA